MGLYAEKVGLGVGGTSRKLGKKGEAVQCACLDAFMYYCYLHLCKLSLPPPSPSHIFSRKCTSAEKHLQRSSRAFPDCVWQKRRFRYSDAERRMHLGSRQFHYTESSCFRSASRPLCRLPSTENWKHGTNNIMCYSNFAPGLVICPSAVTSVADRANVPASLPVFPCHLSLKLSRLHDRSAIVALSENTFFVV